MTCSLSQREALHWPFVSARLALPACCSHQQCKLSLAKVGTTGGRQRGVLCGTALPRRLQTWCQALAVLKQPHSRCPWAWAPARATWQPVAHTGLCCGWLHSPLLQLNLPACFCQGMGVSSSLRFVIS